MKDKLAWFLLGVGLVVLIAARVENVEFGVGGVYDNTVKIERDNGELKFTDTTVSSGVVLDTLARNATSPVTLSGGTIALETIDISDDTNLAVSSPLTLSDDTVGLSGSANHTTSGAWTFGGLTVDSPTFCVDASNNRVGIGTASPTYALQNEGVFWNKGISYFGAHAGPTPSTVIEGGNSGGTSYLKFYTGAYGMNYFFGTGSAAGTRNGIYIGCNGTTGQAILYFSNGAVSPTWDTNLYRSAANILKTDDALTVGGNITLPASGLLQTASGNFELDPNTEGNGFLYLGDTNDTDIIIANAKIQVEAGIDMSSGSIMDAGNQEITIDPDAGDAGSGTINLGVATTDRVKFTDAGDAPTTPAVVVDWLKIQMGAGTYWVPLYQ